MNAYYLFKYIAAALLMLPAVQSAATEVLFDSGERRVTVLELYTSQGCSSCPPAEDWLAGFKQDKNLWRQLIPVAFHVDYWDYLGWRDPYASADYAERQYRYKRKGGLSSVYTPGMLVDGEEWRGWVRGRKPQLQGGDAGRLKLSLAGGQISADYTGAGSSVARKLSIAVLGFGLTTRVEAGENRGRNLGQDFVVVGFAEQLSEDGSWHLPLPEPVDKSAERYALAAWVSTPQRPAPLQAVAGWLQPEQLTGR